MIPDATLSQWLEQFGPSCIIIILFLCTYGFPFSKNIIIIMCGILAAEKLITVPEALLVCSCGLFIGDFSLYILARFGRSGLIRFKPLLIRASTLEKAKRIISEKGLIISVFSARFLPYIRTPIFLSAGLSKMSLASFIITDILSISISVPTLLLVGMTGSQFLKSVLVFNSKVLISILLFGVLLCLSIHLIPTIRILKNKER